GGEKLVPFAPEKHLKLGHLYSLVSNGEFESRILNGQYKGKTFKEFFENNKAKFGLEKYTQFPFVIALVDPKEDLSIQVHPDDKCALEIENREFGKNESWYFIEPPTNRWLYNGCKVNSTEEIKEKIENKRIEEDVIDHLQIEKGDYVFVEQGTIHAATHGALFYEIEENCNLTYRFYDFDRKDKNGNTRELHIEKALMAINPKLKSKTRKYNNEEIEERLYSTKLFENQSTYKNTSNTLECITILSGETNLEELCIKTGTTIILEPGETTNFDNKLTFITARPIIGEIK
ncbi:MAG: class I mannose-6-phosphate isomerase, partial [Candidatus Gastranaerophilales bacterium]|nr:class I mannose-6-phosphate isomerase [Candidatus Gastranaerophilales bacterium]